MTFSRAAVALILACFFAVHPNASSAEYVGSTGPSAAADVPSGTDGLRSVPRDAYVNPPAVGIPMRSIFRDTRAPYYDSLRNITVSPSARVGESVEIRSTIDLPEFRGSFPLLQRGFAPEEADLKIGPVYFKLRHITAAALFSDNIHHSDENRESDVIGLVSIGGQIMAQLSEGFQIAASGSLVFLPFEGSFGVTGYSIRAPYGFGIGATPEARTQVVWEPVFFGLPFIISDEIRIGMTQFRNGAYDGFSAFDGGDFEAYDRAGDYVLRAGRYPRGDEFDQRDYDQDTEFVYVSNEVSVATGGPLPGQNVFRFRASHENLWYDEDRQEFHLPSVVDRAVLSVESVREDLRFKPYVRYEYFHRDNQEVNNHEFWIGARGPVTDLMQFRGEVGMLWRAEADTQDFVARVGLWHTPSPLTWHSLVFSRATSDYREELDTYVGYTIQKTLGPELSAGAFSNYHWIDDYFDSSFSRTEWRNGVRLTYQASPKTTFRLSGQFVRTNYNESDAASEEEEVTSWRARIEVTHRFYQRFLARFIYQHAINESSSARRTYHENLVYLSLSLLFH